MKHFLLSMGILLTSCWCAAQNDQQNLQKYWKFRNDFREAFVKIGPNAGESLVARGLRPLECVDNINSDGTGYSQTPQGNDHYGTIHWGDGMIRHGYYLGLLATEYRLLKNSGQDVTGVLNELYYALNAINRLDLKAEVEQSATYGFQQSPQLNGLYMREDIPEDFAFDHWGNTKLEARCVDSPHYNTNNAAKLNEQTEYGPLWAKGNSYQNSPSNDQFSSLMVGFSLIHKLVDDVFVKPTPSDSGFFVVAETKAIVDRMVSYLEDHNWMMIDVNGWPVNNGGGDTFWANYPIAKAAKRITGHDYSTFWRRKLASLFLNNVQYCITGFGVKGNDADGREQACNLIIDPLSSDAYDALVYGVPPGSWNNQDTSVYQEWLENSLTGIGKPMNFDDVEIWNTGIGDFISDVVQDGKIPFLPFPMNNIQIFDEDGMLDKPSVIIITNYGVAAGLWDPSIMNSLSVLTGNIQQELTSAVIRNEMPYHTKEYYRSFLDQMSIIGPYNLTANNGSATLGHASEGGWGSEHRWTWTSQAYGGTGSIGIFNGLDYMLYHNLYYLKFGNSLPQYKPANDCFCEPAPSISTAMSGPSFPSITDEEYADMATTVNKKLKFLNTCTKNVFAPVNNNVTGQFNIQPYFNDYSNMAIYTPKFQTEHSVIAAGGDVNVKTVFKICNAKTLTIQSGGRMDIEKAGVELQNNAKIVSSGDIVVKSGTTLTIGSLGYLTLKAGSRLIIEENATVIFDTAAYIEYYGGAMIYMHGPTSKLIVRSSIKIMDGGEFKIIHLGTSAGKFIVDSPAVGLLALNQNTTAKFNFTGKGIADTYIILSPGAKLWAMDNMAQSVTIHSCKIEMGAGSAIQSDQPFYTGQVEFYATATNGGLKLSETAIINSSRFTEVPVIANMTIEHKGTFQAYNSFFINQVATLNPNDQALVYVLGQGYNISGCEFYTTKNYGVKSGNMTLGSTISGGTVQYFGTLPPGHLLTGIYDHSSTGLAVKKMSINKCNKGTEKREGTLTLCCNTYMNNRELNVVATVGCLLNMNSTLQGGYNILNKTQNNKNIHLGQGNINIKNGYNFIEYCPNNNTITGTTNSYCLGNCGALDYTKNQWNAANTIPPGLGTINSLANSTYTNIVSPVAALQPCPISNDPDHPDDPDQKTIEADPKSSVEISPGNVINLLTLYPNPATDEVSVRWNLKMEGHNMLTIYQPDGKIVFSESVIANTTMLTFTVTGWKTGLYLVKLSNADGTIYTAKLLVN